MGYNLSITMGTNCYDNWFHVALVVDRTEQTCTMYINGRQQGNPSSFAENGHTDISYDTALPFYIGDDGTGAYNASQTINCDFDEIAVFKKALTADEIAAIYCSISPEYAETSAPETAAPETAAPETAAPETAAPETAAPETAAPETAAPETAAPETAAPETAAPETAAPEENAPQTFDAGVLAAAAAVAALAGAAVAKKRR